MQLSTFVPCSASYPTDTVNLLSPASWNRMDRQPTEGVTAYSMAVPGNNSLFGSSTILLQTEKQSPLNASSNTNGNANTEVAELVHATANKSITSDTDRQNYSQSQEQATWLPLTPGCETGLLGQVASSSMENSLPIGQEESIGSLCSSSVMSNLDSPSQISTLSSLSPSSATLSASSSPPGSASLLYSPPPSSLQQQGGMFVDLLPNRTHVIQVACSQGSDGQVQNTSILCLWNGCNQEFRSLQSLVTHLDRGHTLSMTKYTCHWRDCPRNFKPFDARYKLITHLRCHTGEKPFKCDLGSCNRCFSRLENLKLHVRTHTGEKPYECHYEGCTKKFNNTSDRAKHMKTHVMRKPYACKHPGCDKSYTDPSSMRKHIKYSHKLKDRLERESYSATLSTTEANVPETPSSLSEISYPVVSAPFTSFVPQPINISPTYSLHASLPKESETAIVNSSSRHAMKLAKGTPLVATSPVVSNQPQPAQLFPLPLLQLPSTTSGPNQQLGLFPLGSHSNMFLMPTNLLGDSNPSATMQLSQSQQQVMMVVPQSLNASPIRQVVVPTSLQNQPEATDVPGESQFGPERSHDKKTQQDIEAQLRQTIVQLQQQLNNTQTLLAHQSVGIQQQMTASLHRQTPPFQVILQQVPHVNSSSSSSEITAGAGQTCETTPATSSTYFSTSMSAKEERRSLEDTDLPSSGRPIGVGETVTSSAQVRPSVVRSGNTQFIPVLQPQGLQFLYMPPTSNASV